MNALRRDEMAYRDWIIDSMNVLEEDYRPLLKVLYNIPFHCELSEDENRLADGIEIRKVWLEEYFPDPDLDIYWGPANILEVLLGVARRIEFQIYGRDGYLEWDLARIFWDLIENLGILGYFGPLNPEEIEEIEQISWDFMTKKRHKNALCCNIFHFASKKRQYWRMSIWDQMGLYIAEKWPISPFLW